MDRGQTEIPRLAIELFDSAPWPVQSNIENRLVWTISHNGNTARAGDKANHMLLEERQATTLRLIDPRVMNLPRCNSNGGRSTKYRRLRPFRTTEIKVLLLEGVSPVAVNLLTEAGYQVGRS